MDGKKDTWMHTDNLKTVYLPETKFERGGGIKSNKCFVTLADTVLDSKPITAGSLDHTYEPISSHTCTNIGPHVHLLHLKIMSFTTP